MILFFTSLPSVNRSIPKAMARSCSSQHQKESTLSQLHGSVVVPSTLGYKERASLRREDAYEYGRWVQRGPASYRHTPYLQSSRG